MKKVKILSIMVLIIIQINLTTFSPLQAESKKLKAEPQAQTKEDQVTPQKSESLSFKAGGVLDYEAIKCWVTCLGKENHLLHKLARLVKNDMEFTDQFDVHLKKTKKVLSSHKVEELFKDGVSLCTYLKAKSKDNSKNKSISVSIIDTASQEPVFEKEYEVNESQIISVSHTISADMLETLTMSRGVCEGTLAFTKALSKTKKAVCITDYAGNMEKVVVADNAIHVAPAWHSKAPFLFYSRLSKDSSKLMGVNLKNKRKKVVCAYQGLNMQPSFSADGKKCVLCISSGSTAQLYFYDKNDAQNKGKRVYTKLTNNDGTNASPILLPDDNVAFCSDFEFGSPQIYHLNTKKRIISRLTNGEGYCAAPTYCAKTNTISYTRLLDGTFQLFALSLSEKGRAVEQQLTFGVGDKYEPSLSACGDYIYFLHSPQGMANPSSQTQVAVFNCKSGKIRTITKGKEVKGFPAFANNSWYSI